MSISRIELQGQIARSQDITNIKHNEDNKGFINQTNFQKQFNQNIEHKMHQVHQSDNAENPETRYDAKEKGNGSYEGDGGKKRKKDEKAENQDGKVILKSSNKFDIKI